MPAASCTVTTTIITWNDYADEENTASRDYQLFRQV